MAKFQPKNAYVVSCGKVINPGNLIPAIQPPKTDKSETIYAFPSSESLTFSLTVTLTEDAADDLQMVINPRHWRSMSIKRRWRYIQRHKSQN